MKDVTTRAHVTSLGAIPRQSIRVSQTALVRAEPLYTDKPLPLLVQPLVKGVDLAVWAAYNREWIETRVLQHGALLFRNFAVKGVAERPAGENPGLPY